MSEQTSTPWWKREIGRKATPADDAVEHAPFVPTLPGVSLLPRAITESIAIRHGARVLALLLVILVALGAVVWWLQGQAIAQAQADLTRAQEANAQLSTEVAALAPAKQLYSEITTLEELVSSTLADQPRAREVLTRLDDAVRAAAGPQGSVDILSAAITYTGLPTPGEALTACPNPDPFSSEITIGCLSFTATAQSRSQVSELLRSLEADPLFVGPYVTSTTSAAPGAEDAGAVSFTGSAGIDVTALAVPATAEQIEAIENPPQPSATPGAESTPAPEQAQP